MGKLSFLIEQIRSLSRDRGIPEKRAVDTVLRNKDYFLDLLAGRTSPLHSLDSLNTPMFSRVSYHLASTSAAVQTDFTPAQRRLAEEIDMVLAKIIADAIDILHCDEQRFEEPPSKGKHAAPQPRPRLELHEGRKQLRIDNKWYDYRGGNAAYFLSVLLKAEGGWEPGSALVSVNNRQLASGRGSRADRVYKLLQEKCPKIAAIIESERGGTGGYRIKPKYFTR